VIGRQRDAVFLARDGFQFDGATRGTGGQMHLGAQPAPRKTQGFISCCERASVENWCAVTTVKSSICHPRFRACRAASTCGKASCLHQRSSRWNTEFHLPNRLERTRHGALGFATQNALLMESRLSSAVRPGSLGFPGNTYLTLAHCCEPISCCRIARPPP
jgi:hypothetical protein